MEYMWYNLLKYNDLQHFLLDRIHFVWYSLLKSVGQNSQVNYAFIAVNKFLTIQMEESKNEIRNADEHETNDDNGAQHDGNAQYGPGGNAHGNDGHDDDPALYVQDGKMQGRNEDHVHGVRRDGGIHDAESLLDVRRRHGKFSNDDERHDHDDLQYDDGHVQGRNDQGWHVRHVHQRGR